MMPLEVRAPGKLFVIGEYAVLHGGRALVAAIDAGISCRVESASRWRIAAPDLGADGTLDEASRDPRIALLAAAVFAAREEFAVDRPLSFALGGTQAASRRKLGLGGSAASVVAILAAAAAVAGGDLAAEKTRSQIYRRGFAVHREHQHGRGSGADVAASVYGGWLDYSLSEGGARIAQAVLPPGLRLAAAWSGVTSDTARAIEAFEAAGLVARLRAILDRFWAGAEAGDRSRILSEIDSYGRALEDLGGGSPGAERIASLVAAARARGLAAKGSGAVGGDCVVAVAFGAREISAVEDLWRSQQAELLAVSIDTQGVRREDHHA